MLKSARILGQQFGLTAQEMNHALLQEGFLEGVPGRYVVTDKGEPYAHERDFSRGTGGYVYYNPTWETRSWSPDVVDELDLDDERISEIRQEVAENRRLRREERNAAGETAAAANPEGEDRGDKEINLAPVIATVVVGASIYGIVKVAPHVQALWADRGAPSLRKLKDRVFPGRKEEVEIPAEAHSSDSDADPMADPGDGDEASKAL